MKKILFILTICALYTAGYAKVPPHRSVPAYPGVIERVQPDSDTLQTYLRGDERMHWTMTLDGWQVLENKRGYLCYARQLKSGKVVASCIKAHNKEQRTVREKKWLDRHGVKKEVILY